MISQNAQATAISLSEFDAKDGSEVGYRWLHFDLNDPKFAQWAFQTLPQTTAMALTHGLFAELAAARQSTIKLRRFVRPQAEAIVALSEGHAWPLDTKSAGILQEAANHALRTIEELDATVERLRAVHDHLELQQSTASGRNSYVLSIVAAIFLPLGFLTGLFGVNLGGMPGIRAEQAFWVLTTASAVIGVALFLIFKFSKWL